MAVFVFAPKSTNHFFLERKINSLMSAMHFFGGHGDVRDVLGQLSGRGDNAAAAEEAPR